MSKKQKSTYDKYVEAMSSERRKEFEKGYKDFLLSEMLIAVMERDGVSVRELAREAGVSPTVVQGIRSGTRENVTFNSVIKILKALGYKFKVEREDDNVSIGVCM